MRLENTNLHKSAFGDDELINGNNWNAYARRGRNQPSARVRPIRVTINRACASDLQRDVCINAHAQYEL